MLTLFELGRRQCRYAITDEPPHYFCGEPVIDVTFEGKAKPSAYCAAHHKLCHAGRGKSWQGLAGMIQAIEETVIPTPRTAADVQQPIDEGLRQGAVD